MNSARVRMTRPVDPVVDPTIDPWTGASSAAPAGAPPPPPPARRSPPSVPGYQDDGRAHLAGYLNNPFDERGRQQMVRQFVHAPLGGHLRRGLEGQELFGHVVTRGEARLAEQATAGVLASGVGAWGLLNAAAALNSTPQTPGTMPMV